MYGALVNVSATQVLKVVFEDFHFRGNSFSMLIVQYSNCQCFFLLDNSFSFSNNETIYQFLFKVVEKYSILLADNGYYSLE
jgi:hypothetical protein